MPQKSENYFFTSHVILFGEGKGQAQDFLGWGSSKISAEGNCARELLSNSYSPRPQGMENYFLCIFCPSRISVESWRKILKAFA